MPETSTFFNFDLPTVFSAITLLVAIISPLLCSISNNIHSTKIKKLELSYEKQISYYNKQQSVFSSFLEFTSKQLETDYKTEKIEYIHAYHELLLYTPEKYWNNFESLYNYILKRDKTNATAELSSVTKILGKILRESERALPKLW